MVVYDLNIVGVAWSPSEANPQLAVDPYAVLSLPIPCKLLEAVSWRRSKIVEAAGCVQDQQFAQSRSLLCRSKLPDRLPDKQSSRNPITEAPDHRL